MAHSLIRRAPRPTGCPLGGLLEGVLGRNARYIVVGSGIAPSLDAYCRRYLWMPALIATLMGFLSSLFLIRSPLNVKVFGVGVGAALGVLIGLLLFAVLPSIRYSSRADLLDTKFHAFASILASLLAGGASVGEAIRSLQLYEDELKEFSVEIGYANYLLSLGLAPDEIFRQLAEVTPSRNLKVLFRSLSRGVIAGSNLGDLVRQHLEEYINYYYTMIERVSNSIGILLETFMAVGLLAPITVSIISMLFSIYPAHGISATEITLLVAFFLVPLVSLITVIMVDNQSSKLKL